jgi:hypothetical protein
MGTLKPILSFFRPFSRFLLAVAFLEVYYFLDRVVFIIYNYRLFHFHGAAELNRIFLWGSRMDLAAICLLNLPALFLYFVAQYFPARPVRTSARISARLCFIVLNAAGMAINILDTGYFRFAKHRSNLDLVYVMGDSASSFGSLLSRYLPLLILFIVSIWVLIRLAPSPAPPAPTPASPAPTPAPRTPPAVPRTPASRLALPLAQATLLLLFIIAIRGWQPRPLIPATPLLNLDADKLPLAQNSITTFLYSALNREHQLTPKHYFSPEELAGITTTIHDLQAQPKDSLHPGPHDSQHRKNVVIFILESFSRCYVTPGDPWKARTPFFDSLIRKSIFFPHSFANGFTSNQGIVSILGGLPSFTDEPFFYSTYANTPLHSVGNILKEKGYNTNFFMGAERDHFGFGKFARMAGLDHTYWRNDFDDDRWYDGNWGIFDEPFLQYGARILTAKQQPFLGVFFTISAHPPYTLPANSRGRFTFPGQTDAQNSISYTDYAFSRFFAACRDQTWFRNTIFVFSADHWLDPDNGRTPFSYLNVCTIPIFIYDPGRDTGEVRQSLASQVDVAPTILGLLGYTGTYTGFGRSLMDSSVDTDRYAINRLGDPYQIISDRYILGYDPSQEKTRYFYRYSEDSALKHNLVADSSSAGQRRRLERLIKANIQAYGQALTRRSLE